MMTNPITKVRNKVWLILAISFNVLFLISVTLVSVLLNFRTRGGYYQTVHLALRNAEAPYIPAATQGENWTFLVVTTAILGVILLTWFSFRWAQKITRLEMNAFELKKQVTLMKKRFTANASHELRTPLTMIKGGFEEVMYNKTETIESQMKWLQMVGSGIERMECLINELEILVRLEDEGETVESFEAVEIGSFIHQLVESAKIREQEKDIETTFSMSHAVVTTNPEKLKQLLTIFLDNAFRYVDKHGKIEIGVVREANETKITISNSGPGIPKEELPKIFEYFYRLETSNLNKAGTGLGLPIAKRIIDQLNGRLMIDSVEHQLTTVEITL